MAEIASSVVAAAVVKSFMLQVIPVEKELINQSLQFGACQIENGVRGRGVWWVKYHSAHPPSFLYTMTSTVWLASLKPCANAESSVDS